MGVVVLYVSRVGSVGGGGGGEECSGGDHGQGGQVGGGRAGLQVSNRWAGV